MYIENVGTSGCYMVNHRETSTITNVPGCLGSVRDGIQKGYIGMEMGQSAMGDIFLWLSNMTKMKINQLEMNAKNEMHQRKKLLKNVTDSSMARLPLALDWFNGCRSPFNNGSLKGGIFQLDLTTTPGQLYLAIAEGLACGALQNKLNFIKSGVDIHSVVAAGGLPHNAPLLLQIFADALQVPIRTTSVQQSGAVGASIFGAVASNEYDSVEDAVEAMSTPGLMNGTIIYPDKSPEVKKYWKNVYSKYLQLQKLELLLNKEEGEEGEGKEF